MRNNIVIANWKMNGSKDFINSYFTSFNQIAGDAEIVFTVPSVYLQYLCQKIQKLSLGYGAQNVSQFDSGAFTGEVSPTMLMDMGCSYVLVGHSERRQMYGEDNAIVAAKFFASQEAGLVPVLCVGESEDDRDSGREYEVIRSQLNAVLDNKNFDHDKGFIVAYEPIWAIGTGKVASSDDVQKIHSFIRNILTEVDANLASITRILYGGSLKPGNAESIFKCADVDGGLVGGASLDPKIFKEVIDICNKYC